MTVHCVSSDESALLPGRGHNVMEEMVMGDGLGSGSFRDCKEAGGGGLGD